jgi:hypothetical protein
MAKDSRVILKHCDRAITILDTVDDYLRSGRPVLELFEGRT